MNTFIKPLFLSLAILSLSGVALASSIVYCPTSVSNCSGNQCTYIGDTPTGWVASLHGIVSAKDTYYLVKAGSWVQPEHPAKDQNPPTYCEYEATDKYAHVALTNPIIALAPHITSATAWLTGKYQGGYFSDAAAPSFTTPLDPKNAPFVTN